VYFVFIVPIFIVSFVVGVFVWYWVYPIGVVC